MKIVRFLSLLLVVVGALNWGLVGAFDFNLVESILGMGALAKFVYVLVGIAGVYSISFFFNSCVYGCNCSHCGNGKEE
jgi:uncharacterized membrane protein YuzA (DUF378 family)